MIVFRNILNNYLVYIYIYQNFKNIYYHLYKINILFLQTKNEYPRGCADQALILFKKHRIEL